MVTLAENKFFQALCRLKEQLLMQQYCGSVCRIFHTQLLLQHWKQIHKTQFVPTCNQSPFHLFLPKAKAEELKKKLFASIISLRLQVSFFTMSLNCLGMQEHAANSGKF